MRRREFQNEIGWPCSWVALEQARQLSGTHRLQASTLLFYVPVI